MRPRAMSVSRRASFAAGIAAVRRQKKRANMGPRDIVEEAEGCYHNLKHSVRRLLIRCCLQVKMIRMTPITSPSSPGATPLRVQGRQRPARSETGTAVKTASTDQSQKCKRKSELSQKSRSRKSIYGQQTLFVTMGSYQRDPPTSRMEPSYP